MEAQHTGVSFTFVARLYGFGLLMKLICIVFLLYLTSGPARAQPGDTLSPGRMEYVEPVGLSNLIEKYKKVNYSSPGTEVFRVQLFSDGGNNARERANNVVTSFQNAFPHIPVYLSYDQPNFKVRAGDARTKAEARKIQKTIDAQYPGAFIVRDYSK